MGAALIAILIYGVMGAVCALIASSRGRSPWGWFFIGALAPCLGFILVLVLPDLKVQEERERRLAMENRRLREQVRKDRVVADQRHNETARRLGAHDTALGIDTAPIGASALPGSAAPRQSLPGGPDVTTAQWHYADGTRPAGPIPFGQLRQMWKAHRIRGNTRVWCTGMGDWQPIEELFDLQDALDA